MAMSIETSYDDIVEDLVADVKTAWSLSDGDIRQDPVFLEPSSDFLPEAFIQLGSYDLGESGARAARDSVHPMPFTITGRFAFPSGTTVEKAKMAKVQALLTRLTSGYPRYGAWTYRIANISFEFGEINEVERYYAVSVTIILEVITGG